MKTKKIVSLALATTLISSLAFAGEKDGIDLGNDFVLNVKMLLNPQVIVNKDGINDVAVKDSTITFSIAYKNFIRAVVTTKLKEIFRENGVNVDDPTMKFDEFIKESYFEIRNAGAQPVALIIGKHQVAFAQHIKTVLSENNPLYPILQKDQVFGLTLRLDEGIFGADKVEASVFESKGGDLEIGKINGASVKITKKFAHKLFLTGSYLTQVESDKREHRAALGVVFRDSDTGIIAWAEAAYMKNNDTFVDSGYAITGGVTRVYKTTDVFLVFSVIENLLREVGLGVNIAVTQNLALGIVAKYQDYENGQADGWLLGAEATILLGTSSKSKFPEAIFK